MRLETQGRYAVEPALAFMAAHAVAGLEAVDLAAGTVRRLVPMADGPVEVRATLASARVVVEADDVRVEPVVRTWLGLDVDVAGIEQRLRRDPALAPLVAERPGLRVLGSVDGFETAVLTVVGQQVSLAAARTFGGRLVRAFGVPADACGLIRFPAAAALAQVPAEEMARVVGLTRARARTVAALAAACAGGLRLDDGDPVGFRRELRALPGIGPWTVEYLALRVLRDPDAFPAHDLVLRRALGVSRAGEATERARGWVPYRGYGVAHLWAARAYRSVA